MNHYQVWKDSILIEDKQTDLSSYLLSGAYLVVIVTIDTWLLNRFLFVDGTPSTPIPKVTGTQEPLVSIYDLHQLYLKFGLRLIYLLKIYSILYYNH